MALPEEDSPCLLQHRPVVVLIILSVEKSLLDKYCLFCCGTCCEVVGTAGAWEVVEVPEVYLNTFSPGEGSRLSRVSLVRQAGWLQRTACQRKCRVISHSENSTVVIISAPTESSEFLSVPGFHIPLCPGANRFSSCSSLLPPFLPRSQPCSCLPNPPLHPLPHCTSQKLFSSSSRVLGCRQRECRHHEGACPVPCSTQPCTLRSILLQGAAWGWAGQSRWQSSS